MAGIDRCVAQVAGFEVTVFFFFFFLPFHKIAAKCVTFVKVSKIIAHRCVSLSAAAAV